MHPYQQSNELCFKISTDLYPENTISQQDLIQLGLSQSSPLLDHDRVTSPPNKMGKIRQDHRKSKTTAHDNNKKMMHRDIERQRRQEMAAYSSSLRSLLPFEYIKGKRSISDHMNEAVNYIKHLQKNISVLGGKRDELRKLSNMRSDVIHGHDVGSSSGSFLPCHVEVCPMADGIEILLSSGVREQDFPLSRVLEIVLQEGLVVMSCSSTKVNDRLLHTIQAEVSESSRICNIDPSGLQEKLTEAVSQSSSRFSSKSYVSDS